ncbi:MAG: enoyl-CoA hydratase/isomerase family protein [Pseudomonadales bacterium]
MNANEFKDIHYSVDDSGVATLLFNRPERKNALSAVSFLEIFYAVEHFQSDDNAHVMIMTGAANANANTPEKEAFSSGGYFSPDAMEGLSQEVLDDIDLNDIAQKRTTMNFLRCDKPILAAVNGLAIGGGFTLCLAAADQIYMSEHAWIQLPFAKLGIAAELSSTFLLPRLLGFQKAKELLFFPERISAEQAVDLGIANKVLAHGELLEFTRAKALQLIPPAAPGLSIREMKRIVHAPHLAEFEQALDLENEALGRLFRSDDFAESLTARLERREAVFKGS